MTGTGPVCAVCRASDWHRLPDVGAGLSVTTGGRLLSEPLGKAHCRQCGLGQRVAERYLALTDFYEKRYNFYERPGARHYDRDRYSEMAAWIRAAVPGTPARVLDAGCGRGWMLEAMAEAFPDAHLTGIEPSEAESDNARRAGFNVTTGRVNADAPPSARYDLVYSTNVIEHTDSPVDFLRGLALLVTPDGHIIITLPDGTEPGAEWLFADQNFSLLPAHMPRLAAQAGLVVTGWSTRPGVTSLRDKQLVVFQTASSPQPDNVVPSMDPPDQLLHRRIQYLEGWTRCRQRLDQASREPGRVWNFGTSTWSFLLAAYCPEYWERVGNCVIDGGTGHFLGKGVLDAGAVAFEPSDVIGLGVDPDRQGMFLERLSASGTRVVSWNDLVAR